MDKKRIKDYLAAPFYFVYGMLYAFAWTSITVLKWIDRKLDEIVEEHGLKVRG